MYTYHVVSLCFKLLYIDMCIYIYSLHIEKAFTSRINSLVDLMYECFITINTKNKKKTITINKKKEIQLERKVM